MYTTTRHGVKQINDHNNNYNVNVRDFLRPRDERRIDRQATPNNALQTSIGGVKQPRKPATLSVSMPPAGRA